MEEKYDSANDTRAHIERVQVLLSQIRDNLTTRLLWHDCSKLRSPEKEYFDKYTPILRNLTYGSEEYMENLKLLGEGLNHHYANNSHHPEHYENGVAGMSLLDLIEMFADWKAATERHKDGSLEKSIAFNKSRFGYDSLLESIFNNTQKELRW